ncbi:hypothetical protein FE697_017205 [Mumia zhuanghuii]|uniref:Uncharacterized protein n=2 Tax=Mumia TaxID=1546255 RepID=A0ABW1QRT9_9ACTN|nr:MULTISPECIES: hypothetical protein [Mumia]KAA1420680.1 hypothetical protein FE697_017205 [Mumia zhuanghuii]
MTVLFTDYPARPEDVVRSAETLTARSGEVREVAREAAAGVRRARTVTAGSLPELIDALASPPAAIGDGLHEAGTFASSVLHAWALAVALYDGGCAVLNEEFAIATARGFGVPEPRSGEAADPAAYPAYDAALASARAATVARLHAKHAHLEAALDGTARKLASLLDQGPSADGWRALGSLGPVPSQYAPPAAPRPTRGGDDPAVTALTLLLGDPRVCIGDDANIPECVLELAALVGPLKALKIKKALKALDELDDAKDTKSAAEAAARRADHLRKNPPEVVKVGNVKLPGVPKGVVGELAENGKGMRYKIPPGTPELDKGVDEIRIMDPTASGKHTYPNGYVVYMRGKQAVNPITGETISKKDPLWHIPLQ